MCGVAIDVHSARVRARAQGIDIAAACHRPPPQCNAAWNGRVFDPARLIPHADWMLSIYCQSEPTGPYADGSVVARTACRADQIPPYVEAEFRGVASSFKFSYDTMCIFNDSSCS